MPSREILVVGAGMYLGRLVRELLAGQPRRWRALDSHPFEPLSTQETVICGDLADQDVVDRACGGCSTVIDLSKLDLERSWGNDADGIANSVVGFWQAMNANGIGRVISFNSDGIVGFYRRSVMLDHLSTPRPDGPAGIVAALNESLAALYAYKYGIRALCVRMGNCRPEPLDERMLSTWISPGDFSRLVAAALSADYTYEVVYGVSANADRWWDNANAHRLGYRPLDRADDFALRLRGQRSSNAIENSFQGGKSAADDFAGDPRRIP